MISYQQSTFLSQGLEKEEQIKANVYRRKEIKVKADINKIENRKTREKMNEAMSWSFLKNKFGKHLNSLRLIKMTSISK